jgi:L-asparagine transporter-like permease
VWISAVAGILGVLAAAWAPNTLFAFLVSASGALIVFVYIMSAIAQIRLRHRRERDGTPQPALRMWGFPWLSWFSIAVMGVVLLAMAVTPSQQKDLYFSILALLIAAGAYLVRRSRVARTRSPASSPAS